MKASHKLWINYSVYPLPLILKVGSVHLDRNMNVEWDWIGRCIYASHSTLRCMPASYEVIKDRWTAVPVELYGFLLMMSHENQEICLEVLVLLTYVASPPCNSNRCHLWRQSEHLLSLVINVYKPLTVCDLCFHFYCRIWSRMQYLWGLSLVTLRWSLRIADNAFPIASWSPEFSHLWNLCQT